MRKGLVPRFSAAARPGRRPTAGRPFAARSPARRRRRESKARRNSGAAPDRPQACRSRPAQFSASSSASRSSGTSGAAISMSCSSCRTAPLPRFSAFLRRAWSTRIRRIASAAAAKKWPRLSQRLAFSAHVGLRHDAHHQAADTPREPGPSPAASGPASPGPASRRQLPQLVVDQRQELLGGADRPAQSERGSA